MIKKTALPIATIVLAAIVFSACVPEEQSKPEQTPVEQPSTQVEPEPRAESAIESVIIGKPLTVETSYMSPAGEEAVAFTLYVEESGLIIHAETEVLGKNPTTIVRQTSFANEFPGVLVGQNINDLSQVDRIGGSSLTTAEFNASIQKLKAQL